MPFGHPFARPFGGGPHVLDIELAAMLDALAPGWDDGEDTENYAECYAHALCVAMIWAINGRCEGRMIPARMLETLSTWEEACGLRPKATDTAQARRRAVAAQLRGIVGNTIADLYDVCAAIAGSAFLGFTSPATPTTYTPGLHPGPPGLESSSNRSHLGVRIDSIIYADAAFLSVIRELNRRLNLVCPSWMTFSVGTDEGGAIADIAVVDQTMLGA